MWMRREEISSFSSPFPPSLRNRKRQTARELVGGYPSLSAQSPPTRTIRYSAATCALDHLESSGSYHVCQDDHRTWFSYHPTDDPPWTPSLVPKIVRRVHFAGDVMLRVRAYASGTSPVVIYQLPFDSLGYSLSPIFLSPDDLPPPSLASAHHTKRCVPTIS